MAYLDWASVLVFIAAVVAGLIFFLDGRMVLFVSRVDTAPGASLTDNKGGISDELAFA